MTTTIKSIPSPSSRIPNVNRRIPPKLSSSMPTVAMAEILVTSEAVALEVSIAVAITLAMAVVAAGLGRSPPALGRDRRR